MTIVIRYIFDRFDSYSMAVYLVQYMVYFVAFYVFFLSCYCDPSLCAAICCRIKTGNIRDVRMWTVASWPVRLNNERLRAEVCFIYERSC